MLVHKASTREWKATDYAGIELSPGDYLFTSPGEQHDVFGVSDALIFVSSQKSTPVLG
jgi:quercetin dioxygenase-like cupin family protein